MEDVPAPVPEIVDWRLVERPLEVAIRDSARTREERRVESDNRESLATAVESPNVRAQRRAQREEAKLRARQQKRERRRNGEAGAVSEPSAGEDREPRIHDSSFDELLRPRDDSQSSPPDVKEFE